jgi:hypothetical protein
MTMKSPSEPANTEHSGMKNIKCAICDNKNPIASNSSIFLCKNCNWMYYPGVDRAHKFIAYDTGVYFFRWIRKDLEIHVKNGMEYELLYTYKSENYNSYKSLASLDDKKCISILDMLIFK